MRRQHGSSTVELAILTPLLVLIMLFAVFAGRMVNAKLDIDSAARQAARAASIARSPGQAGADGRGTAQAVLNERSVPCSSTSTSVDTSAFRPGGYVRAEVTCAVRVSDLSGFGLPGSRTYRSSFTSPVDPWREVAP